MDLIPIIERYRDQFLDQYAQRLTQQHINAIDAVADCRTDRYGKILLTCSPCNAHQTRFHSCGNRHCPQCQQHDTTRWLARQQQKLLPAEYFMVTFTLPYELRNLAWHHQKSLYSILFNSAVSTLKDFGINDKKLGADLGMTGVLHTHSRRLDSLLLRSSSRTHHCPRRLHSSTPTPMEETAWQLSLQCACPSQGLSRQSPRRRSQYRAITTYWHTHSVGCRLPTRWQGFTCSAISISLPVSWGHQRKKHHS
jgi:hypothetical protein